MSSELKVNKITPESGTTLTLGDSGDSVAFASGAFPALANLTVSGDLTVDTNSLKVDSTNNRVGIGKTNPSTALDVVGTTTATLFAGSGASLTTLNANELDSGTLPDARFPATLPAISGANLTNLDAADLASGTVPTARLGSGTASSTTFLAGDSSFKTVTGTTINSNADDRVITGSGSANTLNGESDLTFNGSTLICNGTAIFGADATGNALIKNKSGDQTAGNPQYTFGGNGDTGMRRASSNTIAFDTNSTERMRIDNSGINVVGAITVNGSALAGGVDLFKIVVINSTSTYTPTSGVKFIRVYCCGGGGGAGGIDSTDDSVSLRATSGGAGGNTGVKEYTATELGSDAAVTIGAGGGRGNSSGGNGGIGGDTSFNPAGSGSTLSGSGGEYSFGIGQGSSYVTATDRGEWTTDTGNSDYRHFGNLGRVPPGTIVIASGNVGSSGAGGISFFGAGGKQRIESSGGNYTGISAAGNSGGGGGGALMKSRQSSCEGGAGGSGVVVIEEYK